jgi:DDE superfamily endonuclease
MSGSCQDITCLKKCALWDRIHGNSSFDESQYLIGDSGYVNAPHMVAAYKNTYHNQDKEDWNTYIAKTRYVNEHCIGVLKSRWFSLKEIRTQLNSTKDSIWMCRWVGVCARLHNFVMGQNDMWSDQDMAHDPNEDEPTEEDSVCVRLRRPHRSRNLGRILQRQVMQHTLAFNRQPGGCLV